jgi:hypothetical protein
MSQTATSEAERTQWAMTYAEEDRVNDDMTATARSATQAAEALTQAAQSRALTATAAAPNAPVITSIDFPAEIPSDKSIATGLLYFTDPNGDVGYVTYEVVSATNFNGATDNAPKLDSGDWSNGAINIYLYCEMPQAVTLRATLFDNAGNYSNVMEFSFTCK